MMPYRLRHADAGNRSLKKHLSRFLALTYYVESALRKLDIVAARAARTATHEHAAGTIDLNIGLAIGVDAKRRAVGNHRKPVGSRIGNHILNSRKAALALIFNSYIIDIASGSRFDLEHHMAIGLHRIAELNACVS